MNSFSIVVFQIFLERAIDFSDVRWHSIQTFFLKRAVESFDMGIVIGFPETGEAMGLFDPFHKEMREFRPVVRLNRRKFER